VNIEVRQAKTGSVRIT